MKYLNPALLHLDKPAESITRTIKEIPGQLTFKACPDTDKPTIKPRISVNVDSGKLFD